MCNVVPGSLLSPIVSQYYTDGFVAWERKKKSGGEILCDFVLG
jgi:hypothetical protein